MTLRAHLLACALSASLAAAQLPPTAVSQAQTFSAGATVEGLFSTHDLELLLGSDFVHVTNTTSRADGDVLVSVSVGFAGAALVHWQADTGALTRLFGELELGLAMGGYSGGAMRVHALDVGPSGELWLFASEFLGVFGAINTSAHLLRVPLVGGAPGGYGPPQSVLSLPIEPSAHGLNLRVEPGGALDLVLDTGDVTLDDDPLAPGHGLYRWFPGLSVIPLPLESYLDIAAATTRGGPIVSGDAFAEDTGLTNIASGAGGIYVVHAATAEHVAPNDDATNGELYDGDILRYDVANDSTSVLIPRQRYLQVSNALGGAGPPKLGREVLGVSLCVDATRDRLYTLEYTFAPHAPSHKVVQLLQWDAHSGEFEDVIANSWDLLSPWYALGQDPLYEAIGVQIGAVVIEGNLRLAADGSLVAAISPGDNALATQVLRITPASL